MTKTFNDMQVMGKDGVEATLKSFTAASKGVQAIAVETTDYARKSFEQSAAAVEKLLGTRSIESAIEVQTEFAKTAYEGFVAQATKMGSLYTDIAKEAYKPLEGYFARVTPAA
jgi:hypothetical protein